MGLELQVLNLFIHDKELFNQYYPYLKNISNIDKEIKLLLYLIKDYYKSYQDVNKINKNDFTTYFNIKYPVTKDKELYEHLISELFGLQVNENLIKDLIENLIEQHLSAKIVSKLLPVVDGESFGKLVKVQDDINNFTAIMTNPPKESQILIPNELSIQELVDTELKNDGLQWHIKNLNNIIGTIKPKTFGLIYAYVDAGKTSFSLAACANFAKQLDDSGIIVYAGNEESANRLNIRLTQALLNVNREQIIQDPDKIEQQRAEAGFYKIKIFDSISHIKEVIKLLDTYNPQIMFIDQATKVIADSKLKSVEASRNISNMYRELSKQYNTSIIGIHQGDAESENKKWLKLSDMYGTKVGVQGELDYAIGIGKVDEASKEMLRYLNIPKNKLFNGDPGKIVVNFERTTCLWKQI